ncbi:MAG: hypothetical protein OHK0029_25710 [Armatimonadaceae bacterium]
MPFVRLEDFGPDSAFERVVEQLTERRWNDYRKFTHVGKCHFPMIHNVFVFLAVPVGYTGTIDLLQGFEQVCLREVR